MTLTGSRSTFQFPSRVKLSGSSLYFTCSMDRTSLCNKVDVVRLYASYRLNILLLIILSEGAEVRELSIFLSEKPDYFRLRFFLKSDWRIYVVEIMKESYNNIVLNVNSRKGYNGTVVNRSCCELRVERKMRFRGS